MAGFKQGGVHLKTKSAPISADVGWLVLHAKPDGKLYTSDQFGNETQVGSGSISGGNVSDITRTEVAAISAGLQNEINNGDAVVFTYSSGNLATSTTIKGTKTFNYDINGNLISISGTGEYKSKSFQYDINGNLTGITIV